MHITMNIHPFMHITGSEASSAALWNRRTVKRESKLVLLHDFTEFPGFRAVKRESKLALLHDFTEFPRFRAVKRENKLALLFQVFSDRGSDEAYVERAVAAFHGHNQSVTRKNAVSFIGSEFCGHFRSIAEFIGHTEVFPVNQPPLVLVNDREIREKTGASR